MTPIKFCGLATPDTVDAAAAAGAAFIGFNFFAPSPRYVSPDAAAALVARMPAGVGRVAVLVDADDVLIDAVIAAGIDTLQLHGHETADRLAEVRARSGLPVWRASGVATQGDIDTAIAQAGPADRLLLDAKAPKGATLPGGNGVGFDWHLLEGMLLPPGWGLAGGLDAGNVASALAVVHPGFVDVSSGIEDQPGVKSVSMIKAFAAAVRGA
jgi:phosphoribosylanthranilate isomerase